MKLKIRSLFQLAGAALIVFAVWACKKENKLTAPPKEEIEEIIPGVTVGYGAEFLDQATYEQIQLIPDPLVKDRAAARTQRDTMLRVTYDLSGKMPPVGNQGMQGSCTGWATAYAARSYFNMLGNNQTYLDNGGKRNEAMVFSPAFVYNQINGGQDGGAYVSAALELIKTSGVCTWQEMPYSDKDYRTQPDGTQKQKAAAYRIKDWGRINIVPNTFRRFLFYDYPIVINARLDGNFLGLTEKDTYGEYIWKSKGQGATGHAMVVVGYDDQRKAFKVQNSWGASWANKGFIWISYELITEVVREAFIMITDNDAVWAMPQVKTGGAKLDASGQVDFSATLTDMGDAAILSLGVCISDKPGLPVMRYPASISEGVTRAPYPYTVSAQLAVDTLWYRAYAQTVTGIVYGDTARIFVGRGNTGSSGIDKNMLLFNSGNNVYALNADDGSLIWKSSQSTYGEIDHFALGGGVVSNGIFAIGDEFRLFGFDLKNGQVKWVSSNNGYSHAFPIAVNDLFVILKEKSVIAIDSKSGALRWTIDIKKLGTNEITARERGLSLTKDGKIAFVTMDRGNRANSKVYLINDPDTGNSLTAIDIEGEQPSDNPCFDNNLMVTGILGNGGDNFRAYSLNPQPKLLWGTKEIYGAASISNNLILGYSNKVIGGRSFGGLKALVRTTGEKKWEYFAANEKKIDSRGWSISGNYAAAAAGDFNGSNQELHVIDVNTGELKWKTPLNTHIGAVFAAGSVVYAFKGVKDAFGGGIAAFDLQTGKELWQSNVTITGFNPMTVVTKEGKAYYTPQSGMN